MCETNCQNYSYGFQNNWTQETIASKYELTCNNESFVNDTNSIGLFGLLCGALTFGMIAGLFNLENEIFMVIVLYLYLIQ